MNCIQVAPSLLIADTKKEGVVQGVGFPSQPRLFGPNEPEPSQSSPGGLMTSPTALHSSLLHTLFISPHTRTHTPYVPFSALIWPLRAVCIIKLLQRNVFYSIEMRLGHICYKNSVNTKFNVFLKKKCKKKRVFYSRSKHSGFTSWVRSAVCRKLQQQ